MLLTEAQQKAITSKGKEVCVIAGAGTGKTTVLAERFIALITGPKAVKVDEVLAITFTEKATQEMKQRVLHGLKAMGLEALKREVEYAHISTIHGFCAAVLRENPVEAQVDPTFRVMDEVTSDAYLQMAIESFLEDPPAGCQELLRLYDEDFIAQAVRSGIRRFRSMGYSPKGFEAFAEKADILEKIIAAKYGELSRLALDVKELTESLGKWTVTKSVEAKRVAIVGLTSKLSNASPDINILKEMRNLCTNIRDKAPKGDDQEKHGYVAHRLKEIKEMLDEREWVLEANDDLEAEADRYRQLFHRAIHEVLGRYSAYKQERQALDFEDLQLKVKELFENHPHILVEQRNRFKAILVDEYQDVNKLQGKLVETISKGNGLFIVGDPKQSIYEFRDADPDQFSSFCDRVKAEGKSGFHVLDKSFRSHQSLLDFINPFFRSLWEGRTFPYHPITSVESRGYRKEVPSVEVILSPKSKDKRLDTARWAEALAVASRVQELVKLSTPELKRWGRPEPYSYGDIAVLFRSSSAMEAYETAFKEVGIPYSVSKGTGFFQSREFADSLSLLQIIDNAQQDIPMAAVLRSPFAGVSPETLFLLKAGAKGDRSKTTFYQALHQLHEIEGLELSELEKLQRFKAFLSRLREARRHEPPEELLEIALSETLYEAKILSRPQGLQRLANMRKMVQFIREHRQEEAEGLADLCRFLEVARRSDISEKEAPLQPEGGNAVNFITIHGAKGLEFPVIVVADMGRKFLSGSRDRGIYVSQDYGICCKHRQQDGQEVETFGYFLSRTARKQRALAEEQRLLYVAMTRAKEHLILAGSGTIRNKENFSKAESPLEALCVALGITSQGEDETSLLNLQGVTLNYHDAKVRVSIPPEGGMEKTSHTEELLTFGEIHRNAILSGEKIKTPESCEEMLVAIRKRLDYREMPLPQKPLHMSVTGLLEYRQCQARYYFKHRLWLPEQQGLMQHVASKNAGPEFGSKVHTMLNLINFGQDLEPQMPALFHPADLHASCYEEVNKLLHSFANSSLFAELKAASVLRRELPFSMKLEDTIISGVMDVLFQKSDLTWAILDYKTDDVNQGGATSRAEDYFFQLALYALAVHRIFRHIPQTVMLYFLRPNIVIQRQTGEDYLEHAKMEATKLVTGIKSESFSPTESHRCESCLYHGSFCKV